ncbi:MAG: hypothetical protein H7326_01845 [Bdellovibrionaceae bacterium]|nr:hypothetical protein [Pseudobdellovibrionaceae bacterium]
MNSLLKATISTLILLCASFSFADDSCSVAPFKNEVLAKHQSAWAALISNSALLEKVSLVRYDGGTKVLSDSDKEVIYDYSPGFQDKAGKEFDFITKFHQQNGSVKVNDKRSFAITGKVIKTSEGTFCQSEVRHYEPKMNVASVDYLLVDKDANKVKADVASARNLGYFYCMAQGGSETVCQGEDAVVPAGYKLQDLLQAVTATTYKIK